MLLTYKELYHKQLVKYIFNTSSQPIYKLSHSKPGAHIRGGVGVCDTPPAFQNRSKVGPEKCISDNQFGPWTSDILGRYIYIIKIN